jgi:glucose uptake protein
MLLPSSHLAALVVLTLSLLCWGLWANTFKSAGKWRFELYYFDFAVGAFIVALIAALTFGTLGFDGFSFTDDLLHASKKQDVEALIAGGVFNLGNMLLLAAIALSGMSIAFPLALGVALITGTFFAFAFRPAGNAALLFSGAAIVVAAIVTAIYAYRYYKLSLIDELVRTGQLKSTRKQVSMKGVVIALVSGIFLGSFLPLLERSQAGDAGLGPYGAAFIFTVGIVLSTFFYNLFFMNLPVAGIPLEIMDYFKSTPHQHLMGLAGGALWLSGMLLGLVAAHGEGPTAIRASVIFGTTQASTVVAALCGLAIWKEFAGSDMRVRALLVVTIALFVCGLAMIAVAPGWTRT